jgi:hypothetical protein
MHNLGRFHSNRDDRWSKTRPMKPWKHWQIEAVVAALVAIIAPSTRALAQSSTAQAETLFRQGKELIAHGKIAEACAAFDASQKLDPTIATLLNQASCRERNGQLATAWGLFLDAERQTRAATDEPTRQLHQVATDHAAKIEPRLSTLTITVLDENRVRGLEILRNTEAVDPGAWNTALPVDGGTYKITARAPGNADWSSTITIGVEHDAKTIETPKLKAANLQASHATPPPSALHAGGPSAEHPRSKAVSVVFGSAALAFIGGAVGFDLWGDSTYDQSKHELLDAKQQSLWHSANTKRYAAEALGAAGIACAGAAVWFYLRYDNREAHTTMQANRLMIEPILTGDRAGLALEGRY